MFFIILSLFLSSPSLAEDLCGEHKLVQDFRHFVDNKCLGLVLDENDVPWKKPRRLEFNHDETKVYVTDMGGWGDRTLGTLWEVDLKTKDYKAIYMGGDWTHGLQKDSSKRLLVGDTNQILRRTDFSSWEVLIGDLPFEGSHPLSHFILLKNDDLILNVGAPSDDCAKGFSGVECEQRDVEGEVRHYKYNSLTDSYNLDYKVLARGLRNSMALLFNEMTGELYQAENNLDRFGTPEEFNVITTEENQTLDFGWPFCFAINEVYVFPEETGLRPNLFANFCKNTSLEPLFLIPAHSSPLDMIFYDGNEHHSDLKNKIVMSWHGHRRSEDYALVSYETNEFKSPLYTGDGLSSFRPLIDGLSRDKNKELRPVGLNTDQKGRLWLVDDVQKQVLIYASRDSQNDADPVAVDDQSEALIQEYISQMDQSALLDFQNLYSSFFEVQTCTKCHGPNEIPEDPLLALEALLNEGWLKLEGPAEEMIFFQRTSKDSQKAMPPSPEDPFEVSEPEIYNSLLDWINNTSR